MTTRIYDSKKVACSLAGLPLSGYADGNFLEVTYDSDQFVDVIGTDGTVSRSKSNDLRATVTIRLMQTSPSNDVLSALLQVDLNADGGAGVGAFMVTDVQGTTLLIGENAWIMKFPDQNFGREAQERSWTIKVDKLNSFVGGNV